MRKNHLIGPTLFLFHFAHSALRYAMIPTCPVTLPYGLSNLHLQARAAGKNGIPYHLSPRYRWSIPTLRQLVSSEAHKPQDTNTGVPQKKRKRNNTKTRGSAESRRHRTPKIVGTPTSAAQRTPRPKKTSECVVIEDSDEEEPRIAEKQQEYSSCLLLYINELRPNVCRRTGGSHISNAAATVASGKPKQAGPTVQIDSSNPDSDSESDSYDNPDFHIIFATRSLRRRALSSSTSTRELSVEFM